MTQHGCFAHIPGTGPRDKACGSCKHYVPQKPLHKGEVEDMSKEHVCAKWTELTRQMGRRDSAKPIAGGTPSCKYWADKKAAVAA